ncbi:hypothetical protein [Natrarchaeobius oligotrophus]|uniref:hypothetical protein n=1 Tax=Natrarchaeobius oligotrophus TaxID=3455743 RepID=UPI0014049894|nr:hypothetical protein [Natrarchaeobius chitinivorans]
MSEHDDDLLVALALTEFSVHYDDADRGLSSRAWQLAADQLVEYDVDARDLVDELELGE